MENIIRFLKNKKTWAASIFLLVLSFIIYINISSNAYNFTHEGELNSPRAGHQSFLIGNSILSYGGNRNHIQYYSGPFESIEIYDLENKKSFDRPDLTNILGLYQSDRIKTWQNYLVIFKVRYKNNKRDSDNMYNEVLFYNWQTNKVERKITTKYSNTYNSMAILANGDVILYGDFKNNKAEKYSFKLNSFTPINLRNSPKWNHHSQVSIPLENNDLLIIDSNNAGIFISKDNVINGVENVTYIRQNQNLIAPKFIPLDGNKFAVFESGNKMLNIDKHGLRQKLAYLTNGSWSIFEYNKSPRINAISIYEVKNHQINQIKKFETNKLKYEIQTAKIISLNDNEIIIIGGTGGVLGLYRIIYKNVYVYNIAENKLRKITSLKSPLSEMNVIVNRKDVYLIGGRKKGEKIRDIGILQIK